MIRLSIIIPVYNVEKYLSRCLESLLAQDISINEYEIIIINDGSTDSSAEIARTYERRYKNIIIYDQTKTGVGAARNTGIRNAKGRYLFFVDSDDYIKQNCLKMLLDCIDSKKLDLLRFNYESINEKGIKLTKSKNSTKNSIYSENIVDGDTFLTDYLGWSCYVWLFLYKTSVIKEFKLLFNETMYFEDIDWMVRVMKAVKRVQSIDFHVYFYFQRTGSITKSIQLKDREKTVTDKLYNLHILRMFSKTTDKEKLILWYNGMISLLVMSILAYVENEIPIKKKEIISFLSNNNYLPLKSFHFTLKKRINVAIINLSPRIYCVLKNKT